MPWRDRAVDAYPPLHTFIDRQGEHDGPERPAAHARHRATDTEPADASISHPRHTAYPTARHAVSRLPRGSVEELHLRQWRIATLRGAVAAAARRARDTEAAHLLRLKRGSIPAAELHGRDDVPTLEAYRD